MSRPKDKGKLTTKEKTEEEAVALAVYPQYARMVGVPLCSFTVQCNIMQFYSAVQHLLCTALFHPLR